MASLVAERLRQQVKAKAQTKAQKPKPKEPTFQPDFHSFNIAGPAGRMEKETGFEQYGRSLSLQGVPKRLSEDSGFDVHLRSLSIESIAESEENGEGFEMYRRSLGIKKKSMKANLGLNFGRSQSDIGSVAEAAKQDRQPPASFLDDSGSTMFRRSLSDDVECKSAKTKQPSRQSLMSSSKPRTVKTPKAVKDALAKMTSMFFDKSTEEQCSSARDDDEFSHLSTEAGSYADEGPFDSPRIVLH